MEACAAGRRPACAHERAETLAAVLAGPLDPAVLADLLRLPASQARPAAEYEQPARRSSRRLATPRPSPTSAQLEVLLRQFAAPTQERKDRRSLVDFNDLELRARALLERSPDLGDEYRERFAR